jgi:O-antigen ligase
MPPKVAALIFIIGIAGLFYLDRSKDERTKTSWALWIPILWLTLAGSRMVSQWLSLSAGVSLAQGDIYLEGSPMDRMLFTVMLFVGIGVLVSRGRRTVEVLKRNWPLLLFFTYCLISVVWSDFAFVAFKRWTKGIGNVAMVLIVLTDPHPRAALKRFITSAGFVLIPVSVLFIKYFPYYGRGYLSYVWTPVYTGVATDKNGLGYDCLLFGLAALFCFFDAWRSKVGSWRNRQMLVHGTIMLMTVWLFYKANSATSMLSFMFGAMLLLLVAYIKRPWVLHAVAVAVPLTAIIAFSVLDLDAYAANAVGRDVSLTGRTELWAEVLRTQTSPFFGVGFESYWLGPRADYLWDKFWWRPNQAHNGYIETYLTLGYVGLAMLLVMLASGYRHVVQMIRKDPAAAGFTGGLRGAVILYNLTEAAFKAIHPLWIGVLLAIATVPYCLQQDEAAEAAEPEAAKPRITVFETEWAKNRARALDGHSGGQMPVSARAGTSLR